MLIQVVNLEKDKKRLKWISKSLGDMDLIFNRADAVRPDYLQGHQDHYASLASRGLFPGEACCSLSHLQCWVNLLNSQEDFGVILEDDVHLSKDFSIVLNEICKQYDEYGDRPVVIKLETFYATVTSALRKHRVTNKRYVSELLSNHGGSAGYILNRATAGYLIKQFSQFGRAIDTELFHPDQRVCEDLVAYQLFPACVIQDHKKPNPMFENNIPNRISIPQKRNTLLLRFKSIIRPLYLLGYNLYLLPKGKRRVQVEYR